MNIIQSANGNCKTIWQSVNKLTGKHKKQDIKDLELKVNNQLVRDPVILAHEHNTFFVRSIQDISDLFNPSELPVNRVNKQLNFSIREITAVEVINIMKTLKSSKTKDIYGLATSFLKNKNEALALPIAHLVNLSIKHSIVLKAWKWPRSPQFLNRVTDPT